MPFYTKNRSVLFLASIMLLLCSFSCTTKKERKDKVKPQVDLMRSDTLTAIALKKSWSILKQGQQLADTGESINDIIKILPDGTIFQTNEKAILFFMKGSIPMLIKLNKDSKQKKVTKGGGGGYLKPQILQQTSLVTSILSTSLFKDEEKVDVVASQKGEDDRQKKKALVISPYTEDFGNYDDGLIAYKYLKNSRNYKDNVEHLTKNLTLDHFASFGDYDLVHLSTHGERFCNGAAFVKKGKIEIISGGESNFCDTYISTNVKHGIIDINKEKASEFYSKNLKYKGTIALTVNEIILKSTFFDKFYQSGLNNKIWIFSACELGQKSDLGETMNNIHSNGHFFYWLNTVNAADAYKAFDKFYENLIIKGLDAKRAYEEIPTSLREGLPSSLTDSIKTTTSLIHAQTNEPRHGIEVVEMLHPEEKKSIKSGDFYPLVGDFGDGKNEALTLKVKLIGYTQAEFEEKQMSISLKVDDETVLSKKLFLPDVENDEISVEPVKDHEYGVIVTIEDISIPDVGDKNKITLKAFLHLNDEKFSIHKERVTIKPDGIIATMRGDGKTVKFTYDDKRKALKIETAKAPSNTYFDNKGFIYSYNKKQGWVKINFSGMMGRSPFAMPFAGAGLENIGQNKGGEGNGNFPIVEWGIRFRMSAFERNPNFKKQLIDCDKPRKCIKFIGVAGQESGVYAIFNPGGRLIELNFKGNTIKYKYGDYHVKLPNAKTISFGI